MKQATRKTRRLTLNDVLAVTLIWAAVIYGLSTKPTEARTEAHAIAASCG